MAIWGPHSFCTDAVLRFWGLETDLRFPLGGDKEGNGWLPFCFIRLRPWFLTLRLRRAGKFAAGPSCTSIALDEEPCPRAPEPGTGQAEWYSGQTRLGWNLHWGTSPLWIGSDCREGVTVTSREDTQRTWQAVGTHLVSAFLARHVLWEAAAKGISDRNRQVARGISVGSRYPLDRPLP